MSKAVVETIRRFWSHMGLDESFLTNLTLSGNPDTVVPTSFKVGHLAQASTALSGLAASAFYGGRNEDGGPPMVKVDARLALLNFGKCRL